MKHNNRNPIQPLAEDERGVLRFKENAIVKHLFDTHHECDMNRLACMNFTNEDRQQFAQLIGYSLSGYDDLGYVDYEAYVTAVKMADSPELSEDKARIAALDVEIAVLRKNYCSVVAQLRMEMDK